MIEAFMLILMLKCCGPSAVASQVIDRLTDEQCHAQGAAWIGSGEKRNFLCVKRQYPKVRNVR